MIKKITTLAIMIISFNAIAQISFEKGYFISNNNQKIECLIKNMDWKDNPTKFLYKLEEDQNSKTATIQTVKEFGINNVSKYVRFSVSIDRSSENINELSDSRSPIFNNEILFLKTLVEAKASLYYYEASN